MIIQCPSCRALVQVSDAVTDTEGRRVGLSCSVCQAVAWLPATAASDADVVNSSPTVDGDSLEDEVNHEIDDAISRRVEMKSEEVPVLHFSASDISALKEAIEVIDIADAEETKAAFIELLTRWGDESAHKKVIQRGLLAGQLAVIGQGYRAVLEHRADDETAQRGRDRVLAAAMTQLADLPASAGSAMSSKKLINSVAIGASILVMVVCGYYIFKIAMPQLVDPEGLGASQHRAAQPTSDTLSPAGPGAR